MRGTYITRTSEETYALAQKLAIHLTGGEMICLSGDLGSGKTTLVKGLARALGISDAKVTSPTFVVMKVYDTPPAKSKKIKHLVHIDAYRLTGAADLSAIGIDDYIGRKDTIIMIEWAERVRDLWQSDAIVINCAVTGSEGRKFVIGK